jgi:hypothetical protein
MKSTYLVGLRLTLGKRKSMVESSKYRINSAKGKDLMKMRYNKI